MARKPLAVGAKNTLKSKPVKKPVQTYRITGRVFDSDTKVGIPGLLVKATDKDKQYVQPLGRAKTDAEGQYEITFTSEQIGKHEKGGPDILVRVFDQKDSELGTSEVIYNAPPEVTVDIPVVLRREPERSAYDKLQGTLAPLLKDRQIADLKGEEINALVEGSGIKRQTVEVLVRSAGLARETGLPTELFYALGDQDKTMDLGSLFERSPESLRKALDTAIKNNSVPAGLRDELERLEALRPAHESLPSLAERLDIDIPHQLAQALEEKQIHTLMDIRRAGGLGYVEGLKGVADPQILELLDAHANLSALSSDATVNAKIIDRGFASVLAIADAPPYEFLGAMSGLVVANVARRLHDGATAHKLHVRNMLTGELANAANRYKDQSGFLSKVLGKDGPPEKCQCKDCEAAVSPLAYLADLLDYAQKYVLHNSSEALFSFVETFYAKSAVGAVPGPGGTPKLAGNGKGGNGGAGTKTPPAPVIVTPGGAIAAYEVDVALNHVSDFTIKRFYTRDGTDPALNPQSSSTHEYKSPIHLRNASRTNTLSVTIKAISARYDVDRSKWLTSVVVSETYELAPCTQAATPTIIPANQTALYAPATIFINAAQDTTIHYTTDGSTPSTSSPVFNWDPAIVLDRPGTYTIKTFGHKAGSQDSPIVSVVVVVEAAPVSPSGGLTAEYYQNSDLSDLRVLRKDSHLQFDWKGQSPDPQIEPDTFSARWTGWITPRFTEDYTFYTIADDGLRLWIDGQLVLDKWILQPPTEASSQTIRLQAGQKHSIEVQYFENQGRAVAMLLWRSPSQRKEVIPASQLSPSNIDLGFLERTFHQPFGQIPASCEFADEQVRQVRICIEVLRSYLGSRPLADTGREAVLSKAEEQYLLAAYSMLLSKIGTSYEEIRLARSADEETRRALADRLGIDRYNLNELFLDPDAQPKTLIEEKLERLFGLRDTNRDPLTKTPGSLLLQWRLKHLRDLWTEQDWPADAYSKYFQPSAGRLPIIDPDVIGPDDFRKPVPKAVSDDPDKAFDIWLRRRDWVDARVKDLSDLTRIVRGRKVPDIGAMLASMYEFVSYPSVPPYPVPPWASTTPVSDFDSLYEKLTQGTVDEVNQAKERIRHDLSLTSESFTRLIAIRAKDKEWESDERNEKVIDKEWQEVYSILVQAWKMRLLGMWMKEEQTAGVLLGPKEFWHSLREPKEADWPPVEPQPFIDPDIVKIQALPEPTVGTRAIAFWRARQAELKNKQNMLKETREQDGFMTMLTEALGKTQSGNTWEQDLTALKNMLNSTTPADADSATKTITNDLYMKIYDFNKLILIMEKDVQTDPLKKPTAAEYAEIFAILTQSWKIKFAYPNWTNEENNQTTGVVYWSALKAKLPSWRATGEARQAWIQALRVRSSAPIIDPDVVGPGDLKTPYAGNLAFDLWKARNTLVTQWIKAFKASPPTLAGLDANLESTTGVPSSELTELVEKHKQGNDIAARLEQLSLDNAAFSYLMRIRNLAANNQPILRAEWNQVYSILTQVNKRREYAKWRADESEHTVYDDILTLSPDYFKVLQIDKTVFPPPPPRWEPIPWRSTWQVRIDWQDMLQSRIDQEKVVAEALEAAVNATEEATLPMLRDALVMAVDKGGSTLDSKAKWVTDYLLIDAKAGGCHMTTRVAQVIETIQSLLWSLRTDQLKDTYPQLDLLAPNFDEEWQWIGSYATWRAAMFVFMYPENILQPSLKKHQTPAFRKLVSDLRGNRRLTPQQARTAARVYSDYLRDVCALQLEACTNARPHNYNHDLLYLFARSAVSQKVYWSYHDPMADPSYAQSFWSEVDGLKDVLNLIGAVVYGQKERGIYLFARTQETAEQKLVFIRYDLGKEEGWSQEATPLELPGKATDFTARLKQTSATVPPQIDIWLPNGSIYRRTLNVKGNGWEKDDFKSGKETIIFADWRDVPARELGNPKSQFDPSFSAKDVATRFTAVSGYASREGYVGAFPNFHETDYGAGRVYGTFLIRPEAADWRDVPARELGNPKSQFDPSFSAKDVATRFTAVSDNAAREGYVGAFPNFHEADYGAGRVYGTFLIRPEAADWRDVPARELGNPKSQFDPSFSAKDVATRFAAVSDYAARQGYIGAFPNFHEADYGAGPVYGVILIKKPVEANLATGPWVQPCQDDPNIAPKTIPFEISEQLSDAQLKARKKLSQEAYVANEPVRRSNLTYIEEAYYFVPMQIALQLQQRGQYIAALDWFRAIYDYSAPLGQRKIYYGLTKEESWSAAYSRVDNWLLDPLNPHAIAETRRNAYTRYTLFSLIRCFMEYADTEFTRDTAESVPRARTLYLTALELLDSEELKQQPNACEDLIATLDNEVRGSIQAEAPQWLTVWFDIKTALASFPNYAALTGVVDQVKPDLKSPWGVALPQARKVIDEAKALPAPQTMAAVLQNKDRVLVSAYSALSANLGLADSLITDAGTAESKPLLVEKSRSKAPRGYVPILSYNFCIPANPVLKALRLRAELNLYKLRNCRNIAGMLRQLEPYAAPTDTISGLPTIGAGGQLVLPGATVLRPTPYRFKVLIERAKQLVQLAAQIEAAMLAALEKRDAEAYNLLKARQDVRLARAGVRLQTLRVTEAEDTVNLAELQEQRSQIQFDTYQEWLDAGLLEVERNLLDLYGWSAFTQSIAAAAGDVAQALQNVMSVGTGGMGIMTAVGLANNIIQANISVSSFYAGYERRRQEWEFQKTLAGQDVKIGAQQVQIAENHVKVVGQEKVIAEMQSEHAEAVVDYLSNKFTNVELYDWMIDTLERVYSFFLQQATSVAKLAENQLAFERHEVPPSYIQADYWEAPCEDMGGGMDGRAPDRRGLTGSARLLQDIYQLDQYAFETDKRKLQLTKTISLAQLSPAEFQRFRETGVMTFRTPMVMFDRDFPGHYLRLIKRLRTSVVALIPPMQGIKATLTSSGLSRVGIGGDVFQTIIVRRDPESVALTSPLNATGLFELESQSEMLFPFEALGVDTSWEFRLPKAANLFDYSTIADVLITFEYTALDSFDYRQQVIQTLPSGVSADRPFSFQHQFADQWYDLHNPDQTETPMVIRFNTHRDDFPPNIDDIKIQQVLLYFARASSTTFEVPVTSLRFTERTGGSVGGGATTVDGVISTRRGNAGSWTAILGKAPFGEWELTLPNTEEMKDRFKNEEIEDILFVITYSGRTPEWPS